MRFALMTEPQQGLSYEEILAAARHAEAVGLEAFFRSDHYGSFPGSDDHPTTDAWTTYDVRRLSPRFATREPGTKGGRALSRRTLLSSDGVPGV